MKVNASIENSFWSVHHANGFFEEWPLDPGWKEKSIAKDV